MTEEEKSQNPEIPKSTEQWGKLPGDATLEEVFSALGMEEETETISEEKMGEVRSSLQAAAEVSEGSLGSTLEKQLTEIKPEELGPLAPADSDMTAALQHEGIGTPLLARKLKILLGSLEPKWNLKEKRWDYFIPSELWRRCMEMIMKVRGDFAPEKRINLEMDATLEELLLASKGMTPEEAKAKIVDYIDVKVIKDRE